jgi:hypothetical protein
MSSGGDGTEDVRTEGGREETHLGYERLKSFFGARWILCGWEFNENLKRLVGGGGVREGGEVMGRVMG